MSEPSCASVSCFVTVVIKRNYNAYSLFVFHFVSKEKYDSLKDSAVLVRLKVISSAIEGFSTLSYEGGSFSAGSRVLLL